jgi:hypothetical protein
VHDSQVTDHDDGGGDIIDGDNNGDIIDVGNSGVSDPWEVQLDTSVFGDVPTAANQLDMTMLEAGMVSILNGANGMDGMDGMDNNGPDGSGNNGNGGFRTAFVPPPPPTQLQLKIKENQVSVHDVLMGRKGRSNSHPGNRRYLKEARRMQMQYAKASNYREKMNVSQELVNLVRHWGGRFLQLDVETNLWNEVDNQTARKKARDALRDPLKPGRQGYVLATTMVVVAIVSTTTSSAMALAATSSALTVATMVVTARMVVTTMAVATSTASTTLTSTTLTTTTLTTTTLTRTTLTSTTLTTMVFIERERDNEQTKE